MLTVHPANPRYFTADGRRALLLTGSHHWDSLVDNGERPGGFDFPRYLDRLEAWGHSFVRLWAQWAWVFPLHPRPYLRTGPGVARDGGPRFDLDRFDPEYFGRLRERVAAAARRGFAVSVMLFQGWSLEDKGEGNPWPAHPFHRDNNANGVDGDPARTGDGRDLETLRIPAVLHRQEAYAARVVEAVGDLDPVLFEISNESRGGSLAWQGHMARHLRALGVRQPIGLTFEFPEGDNRALFESSADWVSPGPRDGWKAGPPPGDGAKVVLLDTDHLWGIGGDRRWVWKAFLRGANPIYMDPLDSGPGREGARLAMGDVRRLAEAVDLAALAPRPRLAGSGFCLASWSGAPPATRSAPSAGEGGAPRPELIAWMPRGRGRVDARGAPGRLAVRWLDLGCRTWVDGGEVAGGRRLVLRPPFHGEAILHLGRPGARAASV